MAVVSKNAFIFLDGGGEGAISNGWIKILEIGLDTQRRQTL